MPSIRRMTEKDLGLLTALLADERSMEIGWVLAPRAWGRGYATELTTLLADRAHAAGRDAVIECSPSHAASRRVAEKCGFIVSGTRDELLVLRLATP